MRKTTGVAAALVMLLSAAASAQDARPPAEIGAGYGGLLALEKGGDYTVGSSRPAIDVRVTLPYTPRFSFEGLTTISSRTPAPAFHVINGLYILPATPMRHFSRSSAAVFSASSPAATPAAP